MCAIVVIEESLHYFIFSLFRRYPSTWWRCSSFKSVTKVCHPNLHIPPTALKRKISVQFLQPKESLPDAKSCFNILLLPRIHSNTEEFNKAMLTSLHLDCSVLRLLSDSALCYCYIIWTLGTRSLARREVNIFVTETEIASNPKNIIFEAVSLFFQL